MQNMNRTQIIKLMPVNLSNIIETSRLPKTNSRNGMAPLTILLPVIIEGTEI